MEDAKHDLKAVARLGPNRQGGGLRFAGDDAEAAVVPQTVQEMMLEYDARVQHYEVVDT